MNGWMSEMSAFESEAASSTENAAAPAEPGCACFRINEPSVIYQTFDQEVVAVHLNTGSYHTLPGIAGEAFILLSATGSSPREMATSLAARYDAPAAQIEQDLVIFIGQLLSQSMVVAIDGPPAPASAAVRLGNLAPYTAPVLESFSDLEGLVLIDPVHDVEAAGWPKLAPDALTDERDGEATEESVETAILPLLRCRFASANVIFERFSNETVAMDLGTGAYHSLSGEAEEIFLLFPSEPTTWEIRNALATKYAVETAELETALRDYLRQLVKEGLIVLEKLDVEAEPEPRVLQLAEMPEADAPRRPFHRPYVEAFAQPSFDGSFGEDMTFSHEHTTAPAAERESTATSEPYARRRYTIRSGDLVYSSAGGETVISDRDEGKYFKLNRAASDVFALLRHKPDVGELVAALIQLYDVREKDLRVALMILLWNLRKVGLVGLERGVAFDTASSPADLQAPPSHAEQRPFTGFDVAMHHDLRDLLRPFNTAHTNRPQPRLAHTRQFLLLLQAYFEEAAAAAGSSDEVFEVAGETLAIRCAGAGQTADLRRAFHHLKATAAKGQPGLTISAWNNGVVPAGPFLESTLARLYENWSILCGPRGEVLDFNCDEIAVIYHPGPDVLSVLDRANGKAFYLLRDDAPLPFWELSSPFRHILHPWFSTRGVQYTHAGAVGNLRGGVLLAGKGGSGKSTTSLLCASAGMLYAADDYSLTRAGDGTVFSLYGTAKLKGPEDLERLPEMAGRSFNEDSFEHGGVGKGTFNLSDLWPQRMASSFPLRAILLPTVTDGPESRLEDCSPADALLSLAPSTLAQLPFSGVEDSLRLAELADKVPCYRLYLGSELARIPVLIEGLIDSLTGDTAG